jgi:hypothetical protein
MAKDLIRVGRFHRKAMRQINNSVRDRCQKGPVAI